MTGAGVLWQRLPSGWGADTPLEWVILNPQSAQRQVGPGRDGEVSGSTKSMVKIDSWQKTLHFHPSVGLEIAREWLESTLLPISKLPKLFHGFWSESVCLGRKWQTIKTFHPFNFTAKTRPKPRACFRLGQDMGVWSIPERCNHRIMECSELERTLKDLNPLPWTGMPPTRSACSGPQTTWPRTDANFTFPKFWIKQ